MALEWRVGWVFLLSVPTVSLLFCWLYIQTVPPHHLSCESAVWGSMSLICRKAIWMCFSNVTFIVTVCPKCYEFSQLVVCSDVRKQMQILTWASSSVQVWGGVQNALGVCSFCAQGARGQQSRCWFGTALWKGCPTGQMSLSGYGPANSLPSLTAALSKASLNSGQWPPHW